MFRWLVVYWGILFGIAATATFWPAFLNILSDISINIYTEYEWKLLFIHYKLVY